MRRLLDVDVADVGPLPTLPPPNAGELLHLKIEGRPPEKTISRSMRNPNSSQRARFMALRGAAIEAMAGRKWYEGGVRVDFLHLSPEQGGVIGPHDYFGGILDTIGGSHGFTFIYLPIVYLDDSQAIKSTLRREVAPSERYEVEIEFLSDL